MYAAGQMQTGPLVVVGLPRLFRQPAAAPGVGSGAGKPKARERERE